MAKSTTSNISIRMDSDLKAAAEALYEELGMNLSTAFNIFVRQTLRERGNPYYSIIFVHLIFLSASLLEKGEFLSKLQKELQVKKPSLLCLRLKGLQKILTSKDTMMLMNFLQILIHDKI